LTELRDRQLISFAPESVDNVEVRGDETFILRKQPPGAWLAGEMPVDTRFVENWLGGLSQLQVSEFSKDIVTDFAAYGLDPARGNTYSRRRSPTRSAQPIFRSLNSNSGRTKLLRASPTLVGGMKTRFTAFS
jgi:hypothetical protein